jgi:hypothetical protein
MRIGTFVPQQTQTVLYAMAGDDCSLHHDLSQLTPKQQHDHWENQVLTCALQVALNGLGKPQDHVAMATQFTDPLWSDLLAHYRTMFRSMGFASVDEDRLSFHDLDHFYESVAMAIPAVELVNLYMISGSNACLHQSDEAYLTSRNVNSKLHFALNAPKAGIPVPHTAIFTKASLHDGAADALFNAHPEGLMVKLLGLAGARNVFKARDLSECLGLIDQYEDDVEVLLQEILAAGRWQEMTVDLTVKPDSVEISNVRQILFAGGVWVGNYISANLPLPAAHQRTLIAVGEYARAQGHVSEEGVNCGVDYFIDGDDVMVTEINARWTGGLFPTEFLKRLGITESAVAFFDMVRVDALESIKAFQLDHLYPQSDSEFAYISMGFTPFRIEVDGVERCFLWQVVVGDFAAFVKARNQSLAEDLFPTATMILEEALA